FEMGITFVLWLSALKLTQNTARISNLIFASPFISLILLATIIGEAIHPTTLIGLIFIMLGLLVQQMKRKKALPTLNEG
ncbi:EamA family transporter, partial [Vibrio anguillarum]